MLSLGEVHQVASNHSFHPGSSLMVMSDLGKSIRFSGFLLALFCCFAGYAYFDSAHNRLLC